MLSLLQEVGKETLFYGFCLFCWIGLATVLFSAQIFTLVVVFCCFCLFSLIGCFSRDALVLFQESGLMLSAKHPVFFNHLWRKPVDLVNNSSVVLTQSEEQFVFNFVLDCDHRLLVNNVPCVTWGHGIEQAHHPVYATNAIVQCVRNMAAQAGTTHLTIHN
jgi:hypothetical protein